MYIIWVKSSENMPLNMHKICRFRSSCTCAKYLHSPFIYSIVSNDLVSKQWWPQSYAHLGSLTWAFNIHTLPEDTFSLGENWPYHKMQLVPLKAPSKICNRQHSDFYFLYFIENKLDIFFHVNCCLADDSHEMSTYFLWIFFLKIYIAVVLNSSVNFIS